MPIVFPDVEPWVAEWMLWGAAALLLLAFGLWVYGLRKAEHPTVSQSHSGSGHIINAHSVAFGKQPFQMTEAVMAEIARKVADHDLIGLTVVGSSRSYEAVTHLSSYLQGLGKRVSISTIGVMAPPMSQAVEISGNEVYVNADL